MILFICSEGSYVSTYLYTCRRYATNCGKTNDNIMSSTAKMTSKHENAATTTTTTASVTATATASASVTNNGNVKESSELYTAGLLPSNLSSWKTIMTLVISVRVIFANLAPIMDCDEVFNYWEPLHFIQFQSGFQTWEYAPQYALRTYAYILPLSLISRFISLLPLSAFGIGSKVALFQLLRSILAAFTGYTEVKFIQGLSVYLDTPAAPALSILTSGKVSSTPAVSALAAANIMTPVSKSLIPFFTLLTNLFAAGMFHASPALLPSVTVMQLFMLSYSYYLKKSEVIAVVLGLVAVLATGWPFCAVLWIPMGMKILFDGLFYSHRTISNSSDTSGQPQPQPAVTVNPKQVAHIIQRTILHAIMIQLVVSSIDYYFYGQSVFPTWNIFEYNATSGGDELYGVEDFIFYVRNLIVNWNGAALLAVMALLPNISWNEKKHTRILLAPMILWMITVFPRPHKEERFLFPMYPLLSVASALTLDTLLPLLVPIFITPQRHHFGAGSVPNLPLWAQGWSSKIGTLLLLAMGSVSILRSMALSNYYSAPLSVYQHLYHILDANANAIEDKDASITVCVAGEWHRFPSSFYLPRSTTTLEYLPSRFKGQLPAPFSGTPTHTHTHTHTRAANHHDDMEEFDDNHNNDFHNNNNKNNYLNIAPFNDQNLEEPSRYIEGGVSSCNYLVDLLLEGRDKEPEGVEHMKKDKKGGKLWEEIYSVPFLDAERTGFLDRVLYIPFGRDSSRVYAKYALFVRKD